MKKVYLSPGETIVTDKTLSDLRIKAAAHDAYLAAYQSMATQQSEYLALGATKTLYELGWLDCYATLNRSIIANAQPRDVVPSSKSSASAVDRVTAPDGLPF